MIGSFLRLLSHGFQGQAQDVRPPGLHLFDIGHGLVKQGWDGGHCHHQSAPLNEGDGPMLQLSGSISLRMDVSNFLQFQTPLQARSAVQIPANVKNVMVSKEAGSVLLSHGDSLRRQGSGHQLRQLHQGVQELVVLLLRQGTQLLRNMQRQKIYHSQLGGVGLGGSHSDLRAGPGINHLIGSLGNGASHHIHNGQRPGAPPFGLPQGSQGIRRLAGLADDYNQSLTAQHRIGIAELGSLNGLHRNPADPFQNVFPQAAHVVGRAAGHDVNALQPLQVFPGQLNIIQYHPPLLNPGADGVPQGPGLLVNLL